MKKAPLLLTSLLVAFPVVADIPRILPHQGRIAVEGTNYDGTGEFRFLLFHDVDADHASGNETAVWSNATTSPADLSEPAVSVSLPVAKGLYALFLGATTHPNMAALPASIEPGDGELLYLRTWFDDGSNGSQQLSPDHPIASTAFALHAANARKVSDGAITSAMLADGAVTNSKLATNAVTPEKVAPNIQGETTVTDPLEVTLTITASSQPAEFSISVESDVSFAQPFLTTPSVQSTPEVTISNESESGFHARQPVTSLKILENAQFPSAAIIDGRPAMALAAPNGLFFIRALDSRGDGWPELSLLIAAGSTFDPSLATIGGMPAVAYFTFSSNPSTITLRFVIAQDAAGSSWSPPVTVGTPFSASQHSPLVLLEVDGLPAILFTDPVSKDLLYTRALDPLGQTWGAPVTIAVASTPFLPVRGDLAVVDGRPAVAFADGNDPALRYVRADDAQGSSWPVPGVADPAVGTEIVTGPVDLSVVNGNPAIAYYLTDAPRLTEVAFTRATDQTGATWGPRRTVYSLSEFFPGIGDLSLAMIDGRPGLLFRDPDEDSVQFTLANDATGDSWPASEVWATKLAFINSQSFTLLEIDGSPAAAFRFQHSDASGSFQGALYVRIPETVVEWTAESTDPGYPILARQAESVTNRSLFARNHAVSSAFDDLSQNQFSLSGDQITLTVDFDEEFAEIPVVTLPSPEFQLSSATTSGFTATSTLSRVVVDDTDDAGSSVSLAVADGRHAIAYYARGAGELRYSRASDTLGTSWNSPVPIDTGSDSGPYVSLAIISDHPAVLYYRRTAGELVYRRANDPQGTSWGGPVVLANVPVFVAGEETGHELTLMEVDGRPAAAWFDDTIGLRYRRAQDTTGTSWLPPLTVAPNDGSFKVGAGLSMALIAGRPAISFTAEQTATLQDVRFVRADDTAGSAWRAPVIVRMGSITSSPFGGTVTTTYLPPTALGIRGEIPTVIIDKSSRSILGTRRELVGQLAGDDLGSAWDASTFFRLLDGRYPALSSFNGETLLSFYDSASGDLRISSNLVSVSLGAIDGTNGDDVGSASSILPLAEGIGIAYYDATNQRLKYLRLPIVLDRWSASDGTVAPITVTTAQFAESIADRSVTLAKLALGGEPGQILRSTGNGAEWRDLLLDLDDDTLTLRESNSIDLGQYFRDDGSEPFSANLAVDGSLTVIQGASFGDTVGVAGALIADNANILNTVIAGAHKLPSPQTFVHRISASGFLVDSDLETYDRGSGLIRPTGTNTRLDLHAPLQLPQGAKVTELEFVFMDSDALQDFTSIIGHLRYTTDTTFTTVTMADIGTRSTSGATAAPILFGDSNGVISASNIDNLTRQYSLFVRLEVSAVPTSGSGLRFYGAKITYTLDTLLP